MRRRVDREPLEWGVASRCRHGEATSGDLAIVTWLPDGALVAAVDGLGHGSEAARAAEAAGKVVRESPSRNLVRLVERCHTALADTRGAAISLAFVSLLRSTMTWVGVGNVEGRVISGDPSATRLKGSLALGPGVPGHELPRMRTATLDVRPGDVLLLATDGIGSAFADSLDISGSPQTISERIMSQYRRPTDDALVVSVRYLGPRP